MNEVMNNMITRRSCRKFKDQEIPEDLLKQILEAAIYAPSGMNKQSWQLTVLRQKDNIEELAAAVGKALGNDHYSFYKPAVFVMVSNVEENTNGLADSACVLQNIFLGAHSLGISSVWINQIRRVDTDPGVSRLLETYGVPADHKVWGCAALGYPAGEPAEQTRDKNCIVYAD